MNRIIILICMGLIATSLSFSLSLGQEPVLQKTLTGHEGEVVSIKFSPDGKLLASASETVRLWNVDTGKSSVLNDNPNCESVAFSPDGKYLAGGIECKMICLWNVDNHKKIATMMMNNFVYPATARTHPTVAFSPDGKNIASWSCDIEGDNQEITFWDVDTHKNVRRIKVDGIEHCLHIAFSPDCKIVAANGFYRGEITELYNAATGKIVAKLKGQGRLTDCPVFSPDGKILAVGIDNLVQLWDVASGKNISTLRRKENSEALCVAFSPDGKIIASGSVLDSDILLWDVATGKLIATLTGHSRDRGEEQAIYRLAFSPNGKMLASGGDGPINIWDLKGLVGSQIDVSRK